MTHIWAWHDRKSTIHLWFDVNSSVPRRIYFQTGFAKHAVRLISSLVANVRFDKLRQQPERFLPPQIACLRGNHVGHALLDNVEFGSQGDLLKPDDHLDFAGQAGSSNLSVYRMTSCGTSST